ncbi:hypothetical protein XENTR_v10017740 [Xenopus tropicalis]|uniref:Novel protein containing four WD domain, G-beta repeats isoform X1 n=1 Tax=Xenopus tropicalis TaxID=8364 RepID=A0A6I8PSE8_XENTR|nr:novel protein containing four WD domain, G-beta repeats isoform X1 [Xenopus tropicalis]XP_012822157.2 novel protein containing four WD domain, G-beta repeats isoform X1 [Xenopus tropicalis]KAE8589779.1 hypothetical protein XENTR_v10017740 [Xenopus tropicalis]KAE8589780.1 hypothetical protein XENTR_v10017740 [Xenopus tropicalis]KAE8589781.1 hypothetical protein XENTR_v10017740 [Xenopus tropicalis]
MDAVLLRKIRKKLRQIETLEHLPRELTASERDKVSRKLDLRCELEELLAKGVTLDSKKEKARTEAPDRLALPVHSEPADNALEPSNNLSSPPASKSSPRRTPPVKDSFPLQNSRFHVRSLKGHNDMVTCALIHGTSIVSGSCDTSVRVWDISSGSELKTLCGHTGGVTCLTLISKVGAAALSSSSVAPNEELVSSGSSDCSIKVWNLNTGHQVLSIYTYSGVSSLTHIPDTPLLVSGSDGGKVEVWDLHTQGTVFSKRAHDEAVTALQVHSEFLYSGSVDGCLKVWRISCSGLLSLLHSSDAQMHSLRGLTSLCVAAGNVYIATRRATMKVFNWKQDCLTRLSNHLHDSGFVDSVALTSDNLLIASGYNIDHGYGYLNVRNGDTGRYLGTLSHPDLPRIMCLYASKRLNGRSCWVTGGRELLLWEECPKGTKLQDEKALQFQFCSGFLEPAPDTESEEEEDLDLWEADADSASCNSEQGETRDWRWCVLI